MNRSTAEPRVPLSVGFGPAKTGSWEIQPRPLRGRRSQRRHAGITEGLDDCSQSSDGAPRGSTILKRGDGFCQLSPVFSTYELIYNHNLALHSHHHAMNLTSHPRTHGKRTSSHHPIKQTHGKAFHHAFRE